MDGCFNTSDTTCHRVLMVLTAMIVLPGCSNSTTKDSTKHETEDSTAIPISTQVANFCGACHSVPDASTFPREAWHDEVKRGYDFYFKSGRTDLKPPVQSAVVKYYRDLAPIALEFTEELNTAGSVSWKPADVQWKHMPKRSHAISFVSPVDFLDVPAWFISDMEHGFVAILTADGNILWSSDSVASNPAAIRKCDLDGNGHADLVCADLGSYLPGDHDLGKVVVVKDYGTPDESIQVIESGLGRVADVRVADLDLDGLNDIAVAEFGWYKTGSVHVLHNKGIQESGEFRFSANELDERVGAIQVAILDLDDDGINDIAALLAQEHEEIVGFLNRGGRFEKVVLSEAQDPSFGSSGMEFADLDNDGDPDILYTNGDTFDSYLAKPYHGISWLENQGDLQFRRRTISNMSGVHRALPADFDNDGDWDIAAVALLPDSITQATDDVFIPSVVWLEQVSPGRFTKHVVKSSDPSHAAFTLTDVNHDGRMDLVLGNFHSSTSESPLTILITE